MIMPILCIGSGIVTSFGIMYFVANYLDVIAFTPSLMMSILVAMSFDYSLFLLSRYPYGKFAITLNFLFLSHTEISRSTVKWMGQHKIGRDNAIVRGTYHYSFRNNFGWYVH